MKCKNLCIFGDSIAKGIGVPKKIYSWVNILSKKYKNINFYNHGIGGETSSDALKRLDDVLEDAPQITTIQFGMNDHCIDEYGKFAVKQKKFEENLITMVEAFRKINSKIILITNHIIIQGDKNSYYYRRHPEKEYKQYGGANNIINEFNQIVRKISAKYFIECIDMFSVSQKYNKYNFLRSLENSDIDDGVHPHILGSKVYAVCVDKVINKIITQSGGYIK